MKVRHIIEAATGVKHVLNVRDAAHRDSKQVCMAFYTQVLRLPDRSIEFGLNLFIGVEIGHCIS